MARLAPLSPSLVWGTRLWRSQVRSGAFLRAALAAVTLVLAGRAFDLFAFTPDPRRAGLLGVQSGALVGAAWTVVGPSILGGCRDADDGWTATLRSSPVGTAGLWWGGWGAQMGAGLALWILSMLTTIVFSTLAHSPASIPAAGVVGGLLAVVVPGLVASAVASWAGGLLGAVAGFASFALGQVGGLGPLRALGPGAVGATWDVTELARTGGLALAAVAATTAGLRRLRL
ncbi:MAG: hypothetical protein JNM10_14095 [Planctomycetia bacterium]|nr:hypothetical protein [Planctomycetia bacterium]